MSDQIISKKDIIKKLLINEMELQPSSQHKKISKEDKIERKFQENLKFKDHNDLNCSDLNRTRNKKITGKKNNFDDSDTEIKNDKIVENDFNNAENCNYYNLNADCGEDNSEDEDVDDDLDGQDNQEYEKNYDDDDGEEEEESDEQSSYNIEEDEENEMSLSKISNYNDEKSKNVKEFHLISNEIIQVNCNSILAEFHIKKFGSGGKGKCIKVTINKPDINENGKKANQEEKWFTPIEFERYCGKENCRDWKRTIKIGGQPLLTLFNSKILVCHAVSCSCAICQNDDSIVGPIRPFIRYRRRKKDEILAENAYKKFLRLKPPTFFKKQSNISTNSLKKRLLFLDNQGECNIDVKKNKFNTAEISKHILSKNNPYIKEIEKDLEKTNEEFWEPLEKITIELVNKTLNLRKMIEDAKRESFRLSKLKLIKEVVFLNAQKTNDKNISKKRKMKNQMYGINKYMIDINIETLAGTTFSLKVSPLESIQSLKAKIQRHEGIPITHQHLVWKSNELEDNKCLNDYNIPNGATIRMVLTLRGGPINTKRMTTEDSLLRDVSDLMEEIQEESNLWNNNEPSQSINKHVTLLLFRDGDHLNLLRVIDRGDITSPISGAMSAASMYVPYDETDHEANNKNEDNHNKNESDIIKNLKVEKFISKNQKTLVSSENQKTKAKMIAIKQKIKLNRKSLNSKTKPSNSDIDIGIDNITILKNSNNKEKLLDNMQNLKEEEKNQKIIVERNSSPRPVSPLSTQNTNLESLKTNKVNLNSLEIKRHNLISEQKMNERLFENRSLKNNQNKDINDDENCYNDEYLVGNDFEDDVDDDEDENYNDDDEDDEDEENDYPDDDDYDDDNDDDDDDNYANDDEDNDDGENGENENEEVDINANINISNKVLKNSYYKNFSNNTFENNTENQDENNEDDNENYDDEENELLLNKSEFLINENNLNSSSPSNGDLMAIMMMTLNGDHLSINGGTSSSLATTALPTIITPFYVTDNEYLTYSNQKSPNKIKNRLSKKYISKNQKIISSKKDSLNNQNTEKRENTEANEENEDVNQEHNNLEKLTEDEYFRNQSQKLEIKQDKLSLKVSNSNFNLRENQENSKATSDVEINAKEKLFNLEDALSSSPFKVLEKNLESEMKIRKIKTSTRKRSRQIIPKIKAKDEKENKIEGITDELPQIANVNTSSDLTNQIINNGIKKGHSIEINNNNNHEILKETKAHKEILENKILETKTNPTESKNKDGENNIIETISEIPLAKSSIKSTPSRMPSATQKRVSFVVKSNDKENDKELGYCQSNLKDESNEIDENETHNMQYYKVNNQEKLDDLNEPYKSSSLIKPYGIYKQRPLPKLDSIYNSQEFNDINLNKIKSRQPDVLSTDRYKNVMSENNLNENNDLLNSQKTKLRINSSLNTELNISVEKKLPTYIPQSLLTKRQSQYTPTATPRILGSGSAHKIDLQNTNSLKSFQQQHSNNSNVANANNRKFIEMDSAQSKIDISRIYSASNKLNKQFSISTNELPQTSKLKLPPVINTSGSTNNINSISINEGINKKKITDLSRYCFFCQRKTGLASSYICRCGNNYCTQHRNAEAHNCTYDYKTEGRKLIEHSNPLVAAPKLPKI